MLRVQLTKSSVQMRLTTVQPKGGETVANTAQSAPTTPRESGALRVRKIFSRIYGSLAILLGFFGISLGVFAILARSTGRTYGDFIEKPDAVPAIFGPYEIVTSIVIIALGILVFRQRVIAAVGLLAFIVATDVLEYWFPCSIPMVSQATLRATWRWRPSL